MKYLRITSLSAIFLLLSLENKSMVIPPDEPKEEATEIIAGERNLKILSWNIYMLPKMVARKGKLDRAHAIVEELKKSDFDIIVFQEAFLPIAREAISQGLDSLYPYQYGPANNTSNIKTSSGVWVISKLKMDIVKTIQFKNCASWDCLARKGALLLEGVWHGKPFQLLGTHLQADNDHQLIRYKQMEQIYSELLAQYKREGVPQIICGDMNTEAEIKERYCEMLDCFGAENGEISGVEKETYDGVNNAIAQSYGMNHKTTYDYILLRKNGIKINAIKRFVSIFKKGKKDLSDHYGVVCELAF